MDVSLRKDADAIISASLRAVLPDEAVRRALESLPVEGFAVEISRVKKSGLDVCDFSVVLDAAHENHDHDMAYLYGDDHAHCHMHEHHHDHDHDHEEHDENCTCGCHDHDHHHHHHADEVFTSWGKETPHKFTKEQIEEVLKTLCETDDYGEILRAKGMVADVNGSWIYFDMVPGEYEIREGEPDYTGRLCVIGTHIDEHRLEELFGIA